MNTDASSNAEQLQESQRENVMRMLGELCEDLHNKHDAVLKVYEEVPRNQQRIRQAEEVFDREQERYAAQVRDILAAHPNTGLTTTDVYYEVERPIEERRERERLEAQQKKTREKVEDIFRSPDNQETGVPASQASGTAQESKKADPKIASHSNRSPLKTIKRLKGEPLNENAVRLRAMMMQLPQSLKGIDRERIDAFMRKRGYPPIPYLIIGPEQKEAYVRLYEQGFHTKPDPKARGHYVAALQLCVIFRDPTFERENGAAITESLAIHEIAHASAQQTAVIGPTGVRVGALNRRRNKGDFWEEAFADLNRIDYMAEYGDKLRLTVSEKLGLTTDQEFKSEPCRIFGIDGKNYYCIPAGMHLENGSIKEMGPALAATALAVIRNKHPEVWQFLKEGTPQAIRQFRNWYIGLGRTAEEKKELMQEWKMIQQTQYSPEAFRDTANRIIKRFEHA